MECLQLGTNGSNQASNQALFDWTVPTNGSSIVFSHIVNDFACSVCMRLRLFVKSNLIAPTNDNDGKHACMKRDFNQMFECRMSSMFDPLVGSFEIRVKHRTFDWIRAY